MQLGQPGPGGMAYALPSQAEEEHSELFSTDDFRIWCMKVIPCTKRFVHDWTVCPFAHAGEKAARRDPRLHSYTGIACPDMKKTGHCIRGERCPYAHNVFEYWLHPTRYRTQLCNDGPVCRRSTCFFAHCLEELRVPACKPYVSPEALARASLEAIQLNPHPLGVQLHSATAMGLGPSQQHMHQSAQQAAQQAALAALNAPPCSFPPPSSHAMHVPQHLGGGHSQAGHLPRLSTDYGSLPRWSDTGNAGRNSGSFLAPRPPLEAAHMGNAGRFSGGSAGRFSSGSVSQEFASSPGGIDGWQYVHQAQQAHFGAPLAHPHSPNHAQAQAMRLNGHVHSSGKLSASSDDVAAADLVAARSISPDGPADGQLAQSLASLKIALTHQHAASSTATSSNHDMVLSTLHHILQEAVANHGSANDLKLPSSPDAVLAHSAAAAGGGMGASAASSALPTPARVSLESVEEQEQEAATYHPTSASI